MNIRIKNQKNNRIVISLFFAVLFIWYLVVSANAEGLLRIAFLDVGQGDAIFIETPNGNQILIDGGPNKGVLREIASMMPFFDHSIDVVMASHPDQDHIGGLPEILKRYDVGVFLEPGAESGTAVYKVLDKMLDDKNITRVLARRGQRIVLDDGVFIDILFPDRNVDGLDANDASIIARVIYGNSSVLLTGDASKKIEQYVVSLDGGAIASTILKLGHHGSRTSSGELFLGYANPEYAVVSAGKDNRYGHPHKEVIDTVVKLGISVLSTVDVGKIVFETDGAEFVLR